MGYLFWTRRDTFKGLAGAGLTGTAASSTAFAANAGADAPKAAAFTHGVASGDPSADGAVIWTRVTPLTDAGKTDRAAAPLVGWELATDDAFESVVKTGERKTDSSVDFTVKLVVDGLEPGTDYFYRFRHGAVLSPVGRMRTLPKGALDSLRIGAVSCSNYPAGFFHAYRHLSRQPDLDLIVHLGDYIYEYGATGYGGDVAAQIGRVVEPVTEIQTLEDYRTRFAQYRTDPDLQAAHAAAPWIAIWDDHETANDSWKDGAENHDPETEGNWATRKAAALKAWYEWMPARDPEPGKAPYETWRAFDFGDLARLVTFETRLSGRSKPVSLFTDLPFIETPFDFTDPDNPKPILDPAALAALDPSVVRTIRTPFDMTGGRPKPILDYDRITALDPRNLPEGVIFLPNTKTFREEILADGARQMMPPAEESFVTDTLTRTGRDGVPWSVIANQVIMAPVETPDLDEGLSAEAKARAVKQIPALGPFFAVTKLGLPWNTDAWNGYSAQRDRLLEAFAATDSDVVVLTGDTHAFWANDLTAPSGARAGVEFGVTSVSSPGVGDFFGMKDGLGALFEKANPGVRYNNVDARGYVLLTLTKDEARAELIAVSDVTKRAFEAQTVSTWIVPRGKAMEAG
ncbi:MAG: alkaline phosphatase D family protein [Alphaproteobacteria bacterium]